MEARDAWREVGSRVEALGLKLKLHLEQEQEHPVGETGGAETENAFEELGAKVTEAFDALGNAAKDPAVKADVRDIAELIKDALTSTLRSVGTDVTDLIEQVEDYAEGTADKLADKLGRGGGAGTGADEAGKVIEVTEAADADVADEASGAG